ncbi:MAG: alpha/beta fold hydrolase [Marinibacterium profundimaris]
MSTYVIVHGAWHDGSLFEETAAPIRAAGHQVHLPTLAGNRPGDAKSSGLDDAISSLVDYIGEHGLQNIVLVGHSYAGMVISGAYDRLPRGTIRRLVYWSAFVPTAAKALTTWWPIS